MKVKSLFRPVLGIITEVLYALFIILGAYLICLLLMLRK
jgi:hypothetical protein